MKVLKRLQTTPRSKCHPGGIIQAFNSMFHINKRDTTSSIMFRAAPVPVCTAFARKLAAKPAAELAGDFPVDIHNGSFFFFEEEPIPMTRAIRIPTEASTKSRISHVFSSESVEVFPS